MADHETSSPPSAERAGRARVIGSNTIVDAFADVVGAAHVLADETSRAFFSQDIFSNAKEPVALVVAPGSMNELARVVQIAAEAGLVIAPRGGGMSYTSGYLVGRADAVCLDLSRMNAVLGVDPTNMTVTVQAGCTWRALNEALAPHKLRTPFWGPLSGVSSTVGGGVSQQNAFFGASLYGPTSESLVSMRLVLADGTILDTAGADRAGVFRHYGPDLAGLFCGDGGALALKAEITLRLIPEPEFERWGSYEYDTRDAAAEALSRIGRANLASEVFGFDPNLARVRMRRASLMADAKALANVVTGGKSLLGGLKEGAKIALAGRSFLGAAAYSAHFVVEGRTRAGVDAEFALLDEMARAGGGRAVENTIPKVMRANPFTPLNNILGPDGERWAPVHGIVAHDQAVACWRALDALFDTYAETFKAHGVITGFLATTLSTTGFLIEPVFLWPEALEPIHEATVEASHLAKLPRHAPNAAATAVVTEARRRVIEVFEDHKASHFQIGRAYPYLDSRDAAGAALLSAIKKALDPDGRINPGALGLE